MANRHIWMPPLRKRRLTHGARDIWWEHTLLPSQETWWPYRLWCRLPEKVQRDGV